MRVHLALALSIAAFAHTTGAFAQADPVETALRLGTELRRTGHDEEALVEFRRAHEQRATPRTAALFGLVAQATGRWLEADRLLREALAAPDDVWVRRNRASLDEALRLVARRVVTLDLRCNVEGAAVEFDGHPVATLPLSAPLRVLAGSVVITVRVEGHVPLERRVVLEPGVDAREVFELTPVTPPPTPPPTPVPERRPPVLPEVTPPVVPPVAHPPAERGSPLRYIGYGALGLGGVSLVFGATALALRESAVTGYNGECPPPGAGLSPRCQSFADSQRDWGTVGAVLLPVGAVLAGAGAILLWRGVAAGRMSLVCAPGLRSVGCAIQF